MLQKSEKDLQETSNEIETTGSAENEQESLPKTETTFELTEQGKNFLTQMCKKLNDFNSQTAKDETFWRDFLFYSYTGAYEGVETETVPRDDFDETVVKISLQEAEAYAKLVFDVDLPDIKPSLEVMIKPFSLSFGTIPKHTVPTLLSPSKSIVYLTVIESPDSS